MSTVLIHRLPVPHAPLIYSFTIIHVGVIVVLHPIIPMRTVLVGLVIIAVVTVVPAWVIPITVQTVSLASSHQTPIAVYVSLFVPVVTLRSITLVLVTILSVRHVRLLLILA